jgi:hypothetical protein
VSSVGASVFILTPRGDFTFAVSGPAVYERLYAFHEDLDEVHRRLTYDLGRFWTDNDAIIARLVLAYRVASAALVIEILALVGLVSDNMF